MKIPQHMAETMGWKCSQQCCQPWDFIPRSWDFHGIFILRIRLWDFSWDFSEFRK